jgi:hypothetical protein
MIFVESEKNISTAKKRDIAPFFAYTSNLTLFSKPMLQRLQSESVQINTSKYISLHQLSRLWVYIEFKLWEKKCLNVTYK